MVKHLLSILLKLMTCTGAHLYTAVQRERIKKSRKDLSD